MLPWKKTHFYPSPLILLSPLSCLHNLFGVSPHFFLLFFFSLLCSIQIAHVAMGKWQNIDLMASATSVAGNILSPRLFFVFFQFQSHKEAIVLYFGVSPDTQHAGLNGGTAKFWSKHCLVSQFKPDLRRKNQLKAGKKQMENQIPAHQGDSLSCNCIN